MLNCPRLAIDVQHLTSDICRQAVFSFPHLALGGIVQPCDRAAYRPIFDWNKCHSTNTPARESNKSTINHINQVVHYQFTHFQLTIFQPEIIIKSAGFRLLPPVPGCILRQLWAVKRSPPLPQHGFPRGLGFLSTKSLWLTPGNWNHVG